MSAKGVRLVNYYVHPVCTPTRAALISGRYGHTMGLQGHLMPQGPHGIVTETTFPKELKKLGYSTYMS